MDLLTQPAHAILAALARRELRSVELLDMVLARIASENPALNAIVTLDSIAARAAAEASDARRAAGEARALDGLVITIKDAFDVAGMVSTAGAPGLRDRVPTEDAATVARLREAGCVILGKSNVPLFSGDFQTYNPIHGTTNNPWDRERSTGGSSGGAAAAVASGMSAFELGSDLGGSLRWPAHACGVFALKPTWSLVSTLGHVPPAPGTTKEGDLVVAGPLARSAEDLALILPVIARSGGPVQVPHLDPRGLRVAVWAEEPLAPVDAAVGAALARAASLLADAGARVDEAARPGFSFAEAFEVYALFNHAIVAAGLPQKVRDRLAADAVNYRPGDLSHRALQARGARLDTATWQRLQDRRREIKRQWATFFTSWHVVLMPPAPVAAIPHDQTPDIHARTITVNGAPRPYFDFLLWSSLASVAHLPAAVVPVMRTADGLPAGVQILAGEGEDATAIATARLLEQLGCRFTPPPRIHNV